MEWIGAWFLIHRDEEEMRGLCDRAGIPADRVEYQLDPYGCNGYIIARR